MKKITSGVILGIILGLVATVIFYCFVGLIVWGIGNLIIFAFGIDFQFTYLMALAIAIVLNIIRMVLKSIGD